MRRGKSRSKLGIIKKKKKQPCGGDKGLSEG